MIPSIRLQSTCQIVSSKGSLTFTDSVDDDYSFNNAGGDLNDVKMTTMSTSTV